MMEQGLRCLRCGGEMSLARVEDLQLGKTSFLLGVWPNLLAGAMRVDIYRCRGCGKLEFFAADADGQSSPLPQVNCPACGQGHDFDYPRCPFCGHEY